MDINFENDVAQCVLTENLIATNVKALVMQTKDEIEPRNDFSQISYDLSRITSIDSMGITYLIGVYKIFSAKGIKVEIKGASNSMIELFKIMKLDEIFGL